MSDIKKFDQAIYVNNKISIGGSYSIFPRVGLDMSGTTDAIYIPVGSTNDRPINISNTSGLTSTESGNGYMRYNSQTKKFEGYEDLQWKNFITTNTTFGFVPSYYVSNLNEFLSAYDDIRNGNGGSGYGGGNIYITDHVKLTSDLTWDMTGINIFGAGGYLYFNSTDDDTWNSNGYKINITAGSPVFKDLRMDGSNGSTTSNNFNNIITRQILTYSGSSSIKIVFDNCIFQDILGQYSGATSGVSGTHIDLIDFTITSHPRTATVEFYKCLFKSHDGTSDNSSTVGYSPLSINIDDSSAGGTVSLLLISYDMLPVINGSISKTLRFEINGSVTKTYIYTDETSYLKADNTSATLYKENTINQLLEKTTLQDSDYLIFNDSAGDSSTSVHNIKKITKANLLINGTNVTVGPNTAILYANNTQITGNSYFTYDDTTSNITTSQSANTFINRTNNTTATNINNIAISEYALSGLTTGYENIALGKSALYSLTTGYNNISIGSNSGYKTTTGYNNIFQGYNAGYDNDTGHENVFIGRDAGYASTNSIGGVAIGGFAGKLGNISNQIFIGYYCAGSNSDLGSGNVAVGTQAIQYLNGGSNNIAFGHTALRNITSGSYNIGIGRFAIGNITTGNYNVAIGHNAGCLNQTGLSNVFLGYQAGYNNEVNNNTFVGTESGYNNTTGTYNTFIGYHAAYNTTTGAHNIIIGYSAGQNNTTGYKNVFIGDYIGDQSTVTGYENTFVGYQVGRLLSTGFQNTLVGFNAGYSLTTGSGNTLMGYKALSANNSSNNIAIGYRSLYNNQSNDMVAVGYQSLYSNTTGKYNTAVGYESLYSNTTTNYTVALGYQSLYYNTSSYNIGIGYKVGPTSTSSSSSNKLYIDIKQSGDSSFIYGEMDSSGDNGRLNINSIFNIKNRSSFPTSPTPNEGDVVRLKNHSTLSDGYYVYNGSNWISIIQW